MLDDASCRVILESMAEGVYVVDAERRILFWNRGAERLTGYAGDDVVGRRCSDNILCHVDAEGRRLCEDGCPLAATIADGLPRQVHVFLHHREGHRVPVRVTAAPVRDPATGRVVGAVEVFDDDSALRDAAHTIGSLRRLALLDCLTGLPNRRYVESRLMVRIAEYERYGWPFGVFMADIDHFKRVNDAHGHDDGDRVLRMVAKVLAAATRSVDVVGRWGGEEFLGVAGHADGHDAAAIAERCRRLVEASSVAIDGAADAARGHIRVTLSLGVATVRPGDTVDSIVARADEMMYAAKRAGRNRVVTDAAATTTTTPVIALAG